MATTGNDVDRRVARVECSNCHQMVHAYRTRDGRIIGATGGAVVLGGLGASIGAGIGIATAGWGSPATYYLGGIGATIGGGYGYIAGSAADVPCCPDCESEIELGI
jgi:hypothetical protein